MESTGSMMKPSNQKGRTTIYTYHTVIILKNIVVRHNLLKASGQSGTIDMIKDGLFLSTPSPCSIIKPKYTRKQAPPSHTGDIVLEPLWHQVPACTPDSQEVGFSCQS